MGLRVVFLVAGIFFIQPVFPQENLKDLVIEENIKGSTRGKDEEIYFRAKKALFNKAVKVLEMQEDVEIKTEKGLSLQTEAIKWDQAKERVFTDKEVKISKDNDIQIQGKGLEAEPSLKEVKIEEAVEVKIPQKEGSFIMINCKGPLEIDYAEGIATFYKEVEVNQKDYQLFSDKATMYFDVNSQTLKKIVAKGNVRILRGKDTSYSEEAIYDAVNKKLILKGSPRLVIFPEREKNLRGN